MARRVEIYDDRFNDGDTCTERYGIRLRLDSVPNWTNMPDQVSSPIVFENLADDTDYVAEIIRYCCGGLASTPLTIPFSTVVTSPA